MEVVLPKLADTLVEGTVTRWLKRPGERVRAGEPLVEVETDKVNSELEAPCDGVLVAILVTEGTTVPVGQAIATIEPAAGDAPAEATNEPAVWGPPAPAAAPGAHSKLAEHLRLAAATVPQGVCVREIPAEAVAGLDRAAALSGGLRVEVSSPSRSDLALPPLPRGTPALLVAGAEREGRRLLTLCYDRRVLDDWAADRLLKRIVEEVSSDHG